MKPFLRPCMGLLGGLLAAGVALAAPLDDLTGTLDAVLGQVAQRPFPQERLGDAQIRVPAIAKKDTAEVQEVPLDEVEDFRLLGHWNVPLKVLMVLSKDTRDEVRAMLDVVKAVRADRAQPGAGELRLHVITEDVQQLSYLHLTAEDLAGPVEYNRYFETDDIWLQDWGEIAAVRRRGETKDRLVVLDTNRGRGLAPLPAKLARMWNSRYLELDVESDAGNYGGNIEVLPEGTLVVGDSSTPALRSSFAKLGYQDRMVVLESDWLTVGHVDEYLTFLPEPDSPLGFSIVKADPTRAMELMAALDPAAMETQLKAAVAAATRYSWTNPDQLKTDRRTLVDRLHDVSYIYRGLVTPPAELPADLDGWVQLNQEVAKIIDRNVAKLVATLEARHGVRPEVVSLPVLFDTRDGRSIAITPDSVNMVVLGRHLAIPDPLLPVFRDEVRRVLDGRGHKSYLVPNWTYHSLDGQLHCGTSVFRHPNRLVFRPRGPDLGAPAAPANARQRAAFRQLHGEVE